MCAPGKPGGYLDPNRCGVGTSFSHRKSRIFPQRRLRGAERRRKGRTELWALGCAEGMLPRESISRRSTATPHPRPREEDTQV